MQFGNIWTQVRTLLPLAGFQVILVGQFWVISQGYDGTVDFGAQLIYLDDGCLDLDGTVTSGNFSKI